MKIQLKRSSVLEGGSAKAPSAGGMEFGELAINFESTDPTIFYKDSAGNIRDVKLGILPDLSDSSFQSGTLDDRFLTLTGGTLTGNVVAPSFVGGVARVSSTPPASAVNGEFWYNKDDGRTYIYYTDVDSSQWVDASPDTFALTENFYSKTAADARFMSLSGTTNTAFDQATGNAVFAGDITCNSITLTSGLFAVNDTSNLGGQPPSYYLDYSNFTNTPTLSDLGYVGDLNAEANPGVATTSTDGLLSSGDKTKLDGIAAGATNVTNNNQITNGAGYITSAGTAAEANQLSATRTFALTGDVTGSATFDGSGDCSIATTSVGGSGGFGTQTVTSINDTVQTSTTIQSTTTIAFANTVDDLYGAGAGSILHFQMTNDGDAIDLQFDNLSSGDQFVVNFTAGAETYTYSSHIIQADFPKDRLVVSYTGTGTSKSQTNLSVDFPGPQQRRITGSNTPIWNVDFPTVELGGVIYSTDDWDVSGSQATHKSSNPGVGQSATIIQEGADVAFGSTSDDSNILDIKGQRAQLKLTSPTDSLTINPTDKLSAKGTFDPIFAYVTGTKSGYWVSDYKTIDIVIKVELSNSQQAFFTGIDNNSGNYRSTVFFNGPPTPVQVGANLIGLHPGVMMYYPDANSFPRVDTDVAYTNALLGFNGNTNQYYVQLYQQDITSTGNNIILIQCRAVFQ